LQYIVPEIWRSDQLLQVAVSAVRQSLQAYDQNAKTASLTLRRKLSSLWTASVGVSSSYESIVQEGEKHDYVLFALPLNVSYNSTDLAAPLDDPLHGFRFSFSLAPTTSSGHPSARFLITQTSIVDYFDLQSLLATAPGRTVLVSRVLGGLASGAGQFDLPPDQRFYAGGGGTIRGYRYQSVGPTFPDGNPIGGTALVAASVELRQRLGRKLGMALFADAGRVSQSEDPFAGEWGIGAGGGVRYYSPVGPVRLDIAFPVERRAGEDRFEIYVGLGQAF
jgi:translocation and assembly module TamA